MIFHVIQRLFLKRESDGIYMNEMEKIARENHHNGNNCSVSLEYLICGVIKAPELDADSVELLKLFGLWMKRPSLYLKICT